MSIKTWEDIEQEIEQDQEQYESNGFITGDELNEGITVELKTENPFEFEGKFGRQYGFIVEKTDGTYWTLATSSVRLLRELNGHRKTHGLIGHKFEIERSGQGYDTQYRVTRISKL